MYFPSICRIIYVIESFKIHFCVGIASLVTGMKDETVSTPTPVPLNLSADFKFDQTFDGTVNYIEIHCADRENIARTNQDGTAKQWNGNKIGTTTFFPGEFFENAIWHPIVCFGEMNALHTVNTVKILITKVLKNKEEKNSSSEQMLKIELLRNQSESTDQMPIKSSYGNRYRYYNGII